MKNSLKVKRVYRLFDTLLGEPFGKFYGSRSSALKKMYYLNEHGSFIILQRFRVFDSFLDFERFVKSR